MSDEELAEREKKVRVRLKSEGYGYDQLYDEMHEEGYMVALFADDDTYSLELRELGEDDHGRPTERVLAVARMSRYSSRPLDRAARQVRAQLEATGEIA